MNKQNGYIPPPIFWKYTAHLLRRIVKTIHPCIVLTASFGPAETRYCLIRAASVPLLKNHQRIIDTPPLYFRLAPCIYTVYLQKRLFYLLLQITYIPLLKITCGQLRYADVHWFVNSLSLLFPHISIQDNFLFLLSITNYRCVFRAWYWAYFECPK